MMGKIAREEKRFAHTLAAPMFATFSRLFEFLSRSHLRPAYTALATLMILPPQLAAGPASNPLNLPDPSLNGGADLVARLNGLTPQAVPEETNALGTLDLRPGGSKKMMWNPSFPIGQTRYFSCNAGSSGGGNDSLVQTVASGPVVKINSYNELYQILIAKPDNTSVKVWLDVPTLTSSQTYNASLSVNPPGSTWFAGATIASIAFHPATFRPETLWISFGSQTSCYTIIPNLQPQLGAFIVPYLPIAIVYQPPGCGQCTTTVNGQTSVAACGSWASYDHGTKIGTTLSWGTSTTSGTIKTISSSDFFNTLNQAAGAASFISGVIPGGQAAASAFDTMGKVASFLGGLSNTQEVTTTTNTQAKTEANGWTISVDEGAHTDICAPDDLFVYLQDVIFVYAVVPKDPQSGNVTPDGIPTVVLTPYHYGGRRQVPYSQLNSQLPTQVADQFRALDLHMNPQAFRQALDAPSCTQSGPVTTIGLGGKRSKSRLICRPIEQCPSLPGSGTNDVTVQEEQFTSSETSDSTTATTVTNATGLLASVFQISPETGTIGSGHAGETTQSITYSSATTNWQSDSTDAGLHLKCPEYYPPAPGLDVSVYFDNLFGTLLAMPSGVETGQPAFTGTVVNQQRVPISNTSVLLSIGGKMYRTRSDAKGNFAFGSASIPRGSGVVVAGNTKAPITFNGTPNSGLTLTLVGPARPSSAAPVSQARQAVASPALMPATPSRTNPSPAGGACCRINAIDLRNNVVSATTNAGNQGFEFLVKDAALLRALKVGQSVFANFSTRQVSLDGRTACCLMVASSPANRTR